MTFLKSLKCSKTIVELMLPTQKAYACSLLDWLFGSVVPCLGKFGPKIQIVSLSWNLVLRLIQSDMVKHELRVMSGELQVTSCELKVLKYELKFKSVSSNPWVASSNP